MLQVSLLGYGVAQPSVYHTISANPTFTYYEPGYNIFSPLEIVLPGCDQIYFTIRERLDYQGRFFKNITASGMGLAITDVTTGEFIPAFIQDYSDWTSIFNIPEESINPLVLVITNSVNTADPTRVRNLKCVLRDNENNSAIEFRIIVEDEKSSHYYLTVDTENIGDRREVSTQAVETVVSLNKISDIYVLFSPFAYFKEVDKDISNFSYPSGSVFYQRQTTYNNEDFDFTIDGYSHTFVPRNVELINVPNYEKAAVLLIDKHLYTDFITTSDRVYVDIGATGLLSDVRDSFRIYFNL